jgi:hypothetical protein
MRRQVISLKLLKKLLLLSLVVCGILCSCKKEVIDDTNFHEQDFIEKFFTTTTILPKEVTDVIEKLEQENE